LNQAEHDRARRGETPTKVRLGTEIERGDGMRAGFTSEREARGVAVRWNQSPTTGRVSSASFAF